MSNIAKIQEKHVPLIFNMEKLDKMYTRVIKSQLSWKEEYLYDDITVENVKKKVPLTRIMIELIHDDCGILDIEWLATHKGFVYMMIDEKFGWIDYTESVIPYDGMAMAEDEWKEKHMFANMDRRILLLPGGEESSRDL